jgi:MFS family permease
MTTAVAVPRPGPFAVLRRRNFTLLWFGQLISTMGTALAELAASILVYRLTGSAAAVGLMLIAAAGPSVVLGLIAGVYVDRLDRKKILVACDLIRAVGIAFVRFLLVHFGVALSSSRSRSSPPSASSTPQRTRASFPTSPRTMSSTQRTPCWLSANSGRWRSGMRRPD